MVSELVSNAIVHGDGQITVRVSRHGDVLRLEVNVEGGDARPRIHPRTIGGWGLQFVDELADDWGTER